MLSNLHAIISKGYLAIDEKHDKLSYQFKNGLGQRVRLGQESN
ncbi:MAG: hypothetical protein QOA19_00745 [Nitrososphaeraceae archaeon]|nr:hypothetical protein [Nitrososphaeraceae archaeon]MDW0168664.1 hypothetical protein [Nitrososphaeraceae archaeon]MDW0170641.1 hypothetical protein [Nitrososphaeraceae archaeon]MDW0173605.1 hypothetical protein [Nitrososphaeraceae archaeon]MDW0182765.1 hypothetical protein [Nitrososphaeraceae archaeon]